MAHDDVVRQQGRVTCPNCGYILQVDASEHSSTTDDTVDGVDIGQSSMDADAASDLSEVIDWSTFSEGSDDDGDFPDDLTPPDGVAPDLPPPIPPEPSEQGNSTDIDFDDPAADEKTPFEPVDAPNFLLDTGETDAPEEPVEWRLRTSSGLTFRFTDPDALLGWKKKINIYREMHVSPDGKKWVDYVVFVKRFENTGDAGKAFIQAGKTTAELEAPDIPPMSATAMKTASESHDNDETDEAFIEENASSVPTTQFTFRTTDRQGPSYGRQAILLIVGLALGAGAAWLALTYFNII